MSQEEQNVMPQEKLEAQSAPVAPETQASAPQEPAQENEPELLQTDDLKKIVETLLFITDRPVKPSRLADVIDGTNVKQVREVITALQDEYVAQGRAVHIVEIGGGFQMATKPEYGRWVRKLYNEKMTTKLSNAALETLAIIAYKQPITRAEMEAIRGVDVAGPLERLLERSLVRVVGKKDTIGRPMVYGTTDEFLRMFGLNKLSELPDLQVFAAKNLHEKQEDLPFGEPLPPLAEPAIIPLDELEPEERLEALGTEVDPFFKRNSYNRGDFFTEPAAQAQPTAELATEAQPGDLPPQDAPSQEGEPSAENVAQTEENNSQEEK